MTFFEDKPVGELIRSRRSVRTFEPRAIEPALREKLGALIGQAKGPWAAPLRIVLIDAQAGEGPGGAKVGTYGVIRGARHYLAAIIPKDTPGALPELGYALEQVVLGAAALGLGTCWLGGTFNRGQFAQAAGLRPSEDMPIVSPIGYPAVRKSLTEKLMRRVSGGDHRLPWGGLFYDGGFDVGLEPQSAGAFREPLELLRLAPSASNSQPWRVVREDDAFLFYQLHKGGPFDSVHQIDMGICMCHFELAAREAGLNGSWHFDQAGQSVETREGACKLIASWR